MGMKRFQRKEVHYFEGKEKIIHPCRSARTNNFQSLLFFIYRPVKEYTIKMS